MDLNLFSTLIANLFHINVVKIDSTADNTLSLLLDFESNFCFHPFLQPMFTHSTLSYLLTSVSDYTMYEIADQLDVSLLLFRFSGAIFLVGPYVKQEYDDEKMQALLASSKTPASYSTSLKLYYTSLPLLSNIRLQKDIEACMISFLPSSPQYTFRRLQGLSDELNSIEKYDSESINYDKILRRYELENHFLNMITTGNVEELSSAFYQMQENRSTMEYANFYYTNIQASMAIIRTLARKAAERSGLSIITIDEITQKVVPITATCQSNSELIRASNQMLLELTKAVRDHLTNVNHYSPIIAKIVEYIHFHLSQDISINKAAKEFHLSVSYLSKCFKEETGMTFSNYVAKKRCEKALNLLKKGDLQIQEISSYVGYPDNNYFVKVFKKFYGVAPSQWKG